MKWLLFCVLFASCAASPSPITAYAVVQPEDPIGWLVFDGNILVVRGHLGGEVGVVVKATGFPVFGPVAATEGKVIVYRREPEERLEFDVDQPLPAWAAEAFAAGQAEALGVHFDG